MAHQNRKVMGMNAITPVGGNALVPQSMEAAIRMAEMMARAKMLPTHLQGSPGDCLMVVEQAGRWGMSPFAVAQCTSVIQGKLMFEGKLVAAALHTSGALATRLAYDYSGEGAARVVRVSAILAGEKEPRFVDVRLADAKTTNGMWTKQPDQQLAYHGARVWARRYAPEVMLGVYAPEEMEPTPKKDDTHPGVTIDAQAEPQTRETINAEIPMAEPPPKRTIRDFVDALELELREAATWEAVSAIATRADVIRAQEVAKNGTAQRLSDMLDAARERTMHAADDEVPV
jgi:hypothetical protein